MSLNQSLENAITVNSMNLICYVSNGYPSIRGTMDNIKLLSNAGCDIIEIDIPTDNPFLDGESLQKRMIDSYNRDKTLNTYVRLLYQIREEFPKQRIILLCYEHTIKELGLNRLISIYHDLDIESFILVGNTNNEIKNKLVDAGLQVATYVRFHMPKEDLDLISNTNGFIYLQAKQMPGDPQTDNTLVSNIKYLRTQRNVTVPIYCGVGISKPEDIQMVKESGGDGVFVGSAVFSKELQPEVMSEFVRELAKVK